MNMIRHTDIDPLCRLSTSVILYCQSSVGGKEEGLSLFVKKRGIILQCAFWCCLKSRLDRLPPKFVFVRVLPISRYVATLATGLSPILPDRLSEPGLAIAQTFHTSRAGFPHGKAESRRPQDFFTYLVRRVSHNHRSILQCYRELERSH